MDAAWIAFFVGFVDPVRWIIAALLVWLVPHRWPAVALAAVAGLVLNAALLPHATLPVMIEGAVTTSIMAFALSLWRHRRRSKGPMAAATIASPLTPHKSDGEQMIGAIKLIRPTKEIVGDAFRPVRASNMFNLDFEDVTSEVIGHLLAFHASLVLEQANAIALAAFALGRSVATGFDAPHEREEQRACAMALGEVLKKSAFTPWPARESALLESATDALFAWDKQSVQFNMGSAAKEGNNQHR